MDYRQTSEDLLRTLCKAYDKMFRILEQIEQCDEALEQLTQENRPDVDHVLAIVTQTERLIESLDQISLEIQPAHEQLDGIKALCQEVYTNPLYGHMEDLQLLVYYYIRKVINKEEINSPDILDRLNAYKESLELDLILEQIPQSQKQVFLLIPDKKNL